MNWEAACVKLTLKAATTVDYAIDAYVHAGISGSYIPGIGHGA